MGSVSTAGALCIFAAVLIGELASRRAPASSLNRVHSLRAAYTIQTELAQVVQSTQGYRKPYFLFYLTHR